MRKRGPTLMVIAVLAAPAVAIAAPPSGNGGNKSGAGTGSMDRSTYLALGASVTLTLTAGDAIELVRTGEPNSTIRGFGLLAAFPIALWGVDRVSQDPHDTASWAVTVASTGLVAYGLWPLVDRYVLGHADDESDQEKPRRSIHAGPTAIAGPRGTGAGLGFAATF
jgi:hypothetical protein